MAGRYLRNSEVTPEMSNWAAALLHNPIGFESVRVFGALTVLARVEIHTNGTATNPAPHPHPGVSLLFAWDAPPTVVDTHPTLPEGIDVNGQTVDWAQVAASGRTFAYIKTTEGVTWTSGRIAAQYDGAKKAGLKVGPYHYFRARDGAEQVDHFLASLDGRDWDLPPCLDIEELDHQTPAATVSSILACVDAMPKDFLIYTMPGFWNTLPSLTLDVHGMNLWVATWGPHPLPCKGLPEPVLWQYSATASVPGFPGHADVNRVLDAAWWAGLAS